MTNCEEDSLGETPRMKTEDLLNSDTILEMEDRKQETAEEEKERLEKEETTIQSSRCKCFKSLCSVAALKKAVPITQWLPRYRITYLRFDIIAGLTVALTVIPQGLAYAAIAGLDLQYGLYSAFMGCFVYCMFGTSKDVTLGPTAIMSILVAEYAKDPWTDDSEHEEISNVTLAILLTFMCGITQIVMSIFRLGFVVHYISHPVIAGFTSAAAIVISTSQVKKILGIHASSEFFHMIIDVGRNIGKTRIWDAVMGITCIIILFVLKKAKEKWGTIDKTSEESITTAKKILVKTLWFFGTARNAVVVILSSLIAFAITDLNLPVNKRPLTLTPNITSGVPPLSIPNFTEPIPGTNETASFRELLSFMGSGLAVIPLMGLLESIAIAQAFARRNNYRIRPTQELLAIGVSNLIGSFVGSYPITGSFSRTAINSQSNSVTPLNGVFTGVVVIFALQFMTSAFQFIPASALAAVIIMAVINMFDLQIIKTIWKVNRIDFIPLAVTFCLCFWDFAYGIIFGITVSLLILLSTHARPQMKCRDSGNTLIVDVKKGLDFPAADIFENRILVNALNRNYKNVVVDCSNIVALDFSAVESFHHISNEFLRRGITFNVTGLKQSLREKLRRRDITVDVMRIYDTVEESLLDTTETS